MARILQIKRSFSANDANFSNYLLATISAIRGSVSTTHPCTLCQQRPKKAHYSTAT